MAAAIRLNYCGQLAPSHRYRNVRYASVPERMKRTTRGFLHLAERNKTNVVRLAHFFERPTNTHVTCLSLAAVGRPFNRLGIDNGSLLIHAARPMGLTSPLLRAAASPPPIPHNSDQLRRRECDCPRLPNKRERAYDNSLRSV